MSALCTCAVFSHGSEIYCRKWQHVGADAPCHQTGPSVLDLGDVLYAPNCFRDGSGRHIMLAWLQEHASRQTPFDYSGCITLPRVLTLAGMPQRQRYATVTGQVIASVFSAWCHSASLRVRCMTVASAGVAQQHIWPDEKLSCANACSLANHGTESGATPAHWRRAGSRLRQEPAPELTQLRLPEHSWTLLEPVTIHPRRSLPVPNVHGSALEVAITLHSAADKTVAASLFLMSDDAAARAFGGGEGLADECGGVAITVSWQEQTLKVSSSCR